MTLVNSVSSLIHRRLWVTVPVLFVALLLALLPSSTQQSAWRAASPTSWGIGSYNIGAAFGQHGPSDERLAIVVPLLTASDMALEIDNMERWPELGAPVVKQDQHKIDLLFLYNNSGEEGDRITALLSSDQFTKAWSALSKSFASHQVLTTRVETRRLNTMSAAAVATLQTGQLFYKLFLDDDLRATIADYDAVFWMASDVHPIREYWASELLRQSRQDQAFWQRGSLYLGRALDGAVVDPENWMWTSAINGNALYASDSQEWRDFLTLVQHQEPPDEFAQPFELSVSRVFRHSPYSWTWQQRYMSRFQYNDILINFGRPMEDSDMAEARSNQKAFFIQGTPAVPSLEEAGASDIDNPVDDASLWNGGEVPASMRLSVLIRTWRNDLPYVEYTVKSIKKHLRNALETVIVMPEEDFDEFDALTWPPGVKLKSEPDLLPNGDIQQKLTKISADKYTQGDFVMHLDSDMVLGRPVLLKDIVWQPGRPALGYAPYDLLPTPTHVWREGTSFAVGQEVEFEFSRNPFHVYPRAIYARARAHIEKVHNKPFVDFLQTRIGRPKQSKPEERKMAFSDFNYLGAFAFYVEPDLMTWVPFWEPENRHRLYPIMPPLVCQGNARMANDRARKPENKLLIPYMRKMMFLAIQTGNCHQLEYLIRTKAWENVTENDVRGFWPKQALNLTKR
ncbi:hypothetical protein OIO90_005476 [Microbotryomycetes sp. JL221]|nr:hypothetical protein OIO90_005476 [Microbotryomycetes sp. JL221]